MSTNRIQDADQWWELIVVALVVWHALAPVRFWARREHQRSPGLRLEHCTHTHTHTHREGFISQTIVEIAFRERPFCPTKSLGLFHGLLFLAQIRRYENLSQSDQRPVCFKDCCYTLARKCQLLMPWLELLSINSCESRTCSERSRPSPLDNPATQHEFIGAVVTIYHGHSPPKEPK